MQSEPVSNAVNDDSAQKEKKKKKRSKSDEQAAPSVQAVSSAPIESRQDEQTGGNIAHDKNDKNEEKDLEMDVVAEATLGSELFADLPICDQLKGEKVRTLISSC